MRETRTELARAEKDLFKRTKVDIVGISSDAVDKQKEFVEKQKLTVSARVRSRVPQVPI